MYSKFIHHFLSHDVSGGGRAGPNIIWLNNVAYIPIIIMQMGVSLDDKTRKWRKWCTKFIKVPVAMNMIEQMTKNLYRSSNRTENNNN